MLIWRAGVEGSGRGHVTRGGGVGSGPRRSGHIPEVVECRVACNGSYLGRGAAIHLGYAREVFVFRVHVQWMLLRVRRGLSF